MVKVKVVHYYFWLNWIQKILGDSLICSHFIIENWKESLNILCVENLLKRKKRVLPNLFCLLPLAVAFLIWFILSIHELLVFLESGEAYWECFLTKWSIPFPPMLACSKLVHKRSFYYKNEWDSFINVNNKFRVKTSLFSVLPSSLK